MHQGTMESEDDLLTRDPLDLMSNQGALPSTSTSLLNCTLLGGISHSGIVERDDGNRDSGSPKCLFPTLEQRGKAQRSLRSSAFPSSLTWDSDSEKETLDEDELQQFSNPHGLAAHSPGSPTSGQPHNSLDIDLCQELDESKHLFHEDIIPGPLEVQNRGDDVTYRDPTTTDSSSQKHTEKLEQDKVRHLPDVGPKGGCQIEKDDDLKVHNQKGMVKKNTKEPDIYTFPGDSEPESPPPGPWAHCTFIQRRRKKRAILRPFSGLGNWHRTTGAGRRARGKPSGAKELKKTTDGEGGMFEFKEERKKKVQKRQKSAVDQTGGDLCQEIFTCVECSIYFKKRAHLREHMREHGQGKPGKKWQFGEKESWSGQLNKSCFECVECGLEFLDRLLLLDHQRCHEESRQKILEEIGKLKERDKRVAEEASCSKASEPDVKEPAEVNSGRFVCLKCSFSSDVPQEFADHAKTHNTRTRAGVSRTSPRFQQKSGKKGQVQSSADVTTTSPFSKRYPIRASKKTKTQPEVGPSQVQNPSACTTQGEESPDKATLHADTVPAEESSQTEEPRTTVANPVEENVLQPICPVTPPPNPRKNASPRRSDVAFKSIGNKRSARAARDKLGRTRASTRLDPKSNLTRNVKQQIQISNQIEEKKQMEGITTPEPEHDPIQGSKSGKKPPAIALDLKASFSPKKSSKKLDPQEEEPKLNTDKSDSRSKCEEDTLVAAKVEEDDVDNDEDEYDEDVVNRLIGALTEEDDEDDDDSEGLLKSVERKCPYCPDRFHNGIGLANHVRGHLNRVGVSYNVRHFISPEEVNAIEKKFSYQKKKKKVANFDPSTFSVMRCEFCSAGFDTRAGLSSHARAHLRDFGITNWEVTVSPINILRELFAKHPDLVLPTPSHTLQSSQDENSDEEHDGEKEEENMTTEPLTLSSNSPKQHWKEKHNISEPEEGGEEAEDDDEEEEEAKIPLTDKLASSPGEKTMFSLQEQTPESKETDSIASSLLKCEFCGATFETRRGLSSHARSHLRQLGIGMSENSGAPIDLLHQIAKERTMDARFTDTPTSMAPPKKSQHHTLSLPSLTKDIEMEEGLLDTKPTILFSAGSAVKVSSSPATSSAAGSVPSSPFVKSRSPSPVLRKAPISSLLPVSSPLRSQEHKTLGKNQATNLSSPNKPFWAPQDTDAPLNLTMEMDSKDIICQLCGAWFETRKGLSSHARAHLRHFGIEYSESKGSPIDLLNRFILTDDFKHKANSFLSDGPEDLRSQKTSMASPLPSTSSSKRPLASSPILYKTTPLRTTIGSKATSSSTHTLLGPPTKKLKPSSMQVPRFSGGEVMPFPIEPMKDVSCEFCGELFENRKGLSSHARSHLRQLGITEWSVNGSPIDTLREIIVRRGLPSITPLKSPKSPSSPNPAVVRSALQSSSPSGNVFGRLPFHFTHSPSQDQPTARKMSPSTSTTSSSPAVEMVKPKPEPELVEVTMKGSEMGANEGYSPEPQHSSLSNSDNVYPVNFVMTQEKEPSRDIRCEFCGEFFENRKGLSSHARSHLRHMGITEWSVNGSPIDTLWEVMRRQGTTPASVALGIKEEPGQDGRVSLNSPSYHSPALSRKSPLNLLHSGSRLHKHGLGSVSLSPTSPVSKLFGGTLLKKKVQVEDGHQPGEKSLLIQSKSFSAPPQDLSFKGKVSTEKHGVGQMDASCELCGFYFENRKALASHARAHLRQFGVTEWCVNGSPIETLSAWIRSRPQKAAEMQQSYAQGARYAQKKRCNSALSPSRDSDSTTPVSHKSSVTKWASLTLPQKRAIGRDAGSSSWGLSVRATEAKSKSGSSTQHGLIPQSEGHRSNNLLPHAQVAHSELNVRVPRGFERRPLKHPSHAEAGERESGPPKPRSSTVPALVPKPPSTPLVRLVGKIYSLKCRFCDVEFQGPLSVQEDWIRHLQQHILNLNYNKTEPPVNDTPAPNLPASAATSTSTTATTLTATPSVPPPNPPATPTLASVPAPTPTQASTAPLVASSVPQTTPELLSSPAN